MYPSKSLSAALVTSSLFLTGVASAATTVTFDPAATNGGAGALSADAVFQAVGFQSNLFSSLVINGNSGVQNFNEVGHVDLTSFQNSLAQPVVSGVGVNYGIRGDFVISGSGSWSGTTYTANPLGLSFVVNLIGDPGNDGVGPTVNLGQATLAPGPSVAFAIAFGLIAPNSSGAALTSLTADLNFTPAAGTSGPGGFFQAPFPLLLNLSIGNAGGNTQNTGYSVDGAGVVTFTTPIAGTNAGTANVTFVQPVPEPGVLSLAGIALLGMAAVGRRKARKAA